MSQPGWEALEGEVHELARRLTRIEHELGIAERGVVNGAHPVPASQESAAPRETTALLPALGRALLGLAGAYLLRALTESGSLPHRGGVAIGIVYAVGWLIWAARTPAERRVEAVLHSLTAVMVLAPLLWEATLRFHALSTWSAGAILLFFTIFGLTVSWRKNLLVVATIATLAGLGTAGALLMATHDVLPFTLVFLAIAAAVEISACLDHWLSERWIAALAADLSVILATWLVTNARGLPAGYAPIPHGWLLAVQIALLSIYLSSTIYRTLVRGSTFTLFETVQCAAAFLVAVGGGLALSHDDPRVGPALAVLTLACAAACYFVSFLRLEPAGHGRNFYTYSTFGILLTLVATRILLPHGGFEALWPALAVACVWAGGRVGRLTLQVHGSIYLLLALLSSGALAQAADFVAGNGTWPGPRDTELAGGALAAAACYALAARYSWNRPEWTFQAFRGAMIGMAAWLVAGIAAGVLTAAYHAAFGASASHAYCATLRTSVVTLAALGLAWAGTRWNISDFLRLAYPAMVLGAYRLVVEDLRQERTTALFLSLLVYGTALMALPRLKRARLAAGRT